MDVTNVNLYENIFYVFYLVSIVRSKLIYMFCMYKIYASCSQNKLYNIILQKQIETYVFVHNT